MTTNFLTAQEVAKRLGISRKTVFVACQQGRLPGAKMVISNKGRHWAIPESALLAYVPAKLGAPLGHRRSPLRTLLWQLVAYGGPYTTAEICERLGCSRQIVYTYLKQIGAYRTQRTGVWKLPHNSIGSTHAT